MRIITRRAAVAAAALIAALLPAGCGRTPTGTATVTGKVSFQGQPLPGGVVRFLAADDERAGSAVINRDGTYEMKEAPVGKVKICVDTSALRRHEDRNVPVPAKYKTFKTTDLKYTVLAGSQTHDVYLE